jgi:4-hydroxybenzoate polyprenyltransferase
MENIQSLIRLMRVEQWVKNFFILLPLFFSQRLMFSSRLLDCLVAFLGFSFIASSIYCLNDIHDFELDRLHLKKKNRPLASGLVNKKTAILLLIGCFFTGILIEYFFGGQNAKQVIYAFLLYYVLNILYTLWLKNIAIIDVVIISTGFVIRILIGGLSSGTSLTNWIIIMTFLLSLFLAFAKRRDDFKIYDESGVITRKNVVHYNFQFLNAALVITGTITIVSYIIYTISPEVISRVKNEYVYMTSIFVIMGILRYLQFVLVEEKSGNPTQILLKDIFIQLCIVGWIGSFIVMFYI